MADNIGEAFAALHERWEAIFAREQGRLATMQQDLPQALREMAHATGLRETESPTYQAYEQFLQDQITTVEALDGGAWEPDPRLDHLYPPGADLPLDAQRAQEVDAANPTALDRIEQLQQRLDAMTSAALVLARQQDQHQGLGY